MKKQSKSCKKRQNKPKFQPNGRPMPPIEHQFSSTKQPANPGRPKGSLSMKSILVKILNKEMEFNDPFIGKKVKKEIAEIITLKLVSQAMKGDMDAIREINNRIDGKMKGIDIHIGDRFEKHDTKILIVRSPKKRDVETVDVEKEVKK